MVRHTVDMAQPLQDILALQKYYVYHLMSNYLLLKVIKIILVRENNVYWSVLQR